MASLCRAAEQQQDEQQAIDNSGHDHVQTSALRLAISIRSTSVLTCSLCMRRFL